MRSIKFRGKSNKDWVYGDVYTVIDYSKGQQTIILETDISKQEGLYIPQNEYYVNSSKIGQFIGLKDKNGIEIYEGDYLIDRFPIDEEDLSKGYNESLLPVVWCDKQLCWCVDASFAKDGSYLTSLVDYFGEFLEVKGNIHERT